MFLGGCLLTSEFRLYVLFTHVFSFHFLRSFISIFIISLVSIFSHFFFLHFFEVLGKHAHSLRNKITEILSSNSEGKSRYIDQ